MRGAGIVRASWAGTVLFGIGTVLGVVAPDQLQWLGFAVSLTLFIAGCAVFVWAFVLAVGRSRTDEIAVSNLYLLSGAPSDVRTQLFGSLAVELVVAIGTAAARPYTIAATAILAPVYGLALCGRWSARYGTFPPRKPTPKRK
ncbi:MAG: hypothetical protein E6G57_05785 [Actinobacteria bacterium]|nr:MAG: hypothetical protein E6G57_05785 [Actinomycetota bacterium]